MSFKAGDTCPECNGAKRVCPTCLRGMMACDCLDGLPFMSCDICNGTGVLDEMGAQMLNEFDELDEGVSADGRVI